MAAERVVWHHRVCLSIECVLDSYHVHRMSGERESWLVAEAPGSRPPWETGIAPFCPRCGGDLVESPACQRPGGGRAAA